MDAEGEKVTTFSLQCARFHMGRYGFRGSRCEIRDLECFAEVFEEFAPDMLAGIEASDDRVDDTGGSVDDIQRWVKLMILDLASSDDG